MLMGSAIFLTHQTSPSRRTRTGASLPIPRLSWACLLCYGIGRIGEPSPVQLASALDEGPVWVGSLPAAGRLEVKKDYRALITIPRTAARDKYLVFDKFGYYMNNLNFNNSIRSVLWQSLLPQTSIDLPGNS